MKNTLLDEMTNMNMCLFKIGGGNNNVSAVSACNCLIALRNHRRHNDAIDRINLSMKNDYNKRKTIGRAVYSHYRRWLDDYRTAYINEANTYKNTTVTTTHCSTGLLDILSLGPEKCYKEYGGSCHVGWNSRGCNFGSQLICGPSKRQVREYMVSKETPLWEGIINSGHSIARGGGEGPAVSPAQRKIFYDLAKKLVKDAKNDSIIFKGPYSIAHRILPVDGSFGTISLSALHSTASISESLLNFDAYWPESGKKCGDRPWADNSGSHVYPTYLVPPPPQYKQHDTASIECCNNVAVLGNPNNVILNQIITSCKSHGSNVTQNIQDVLQENYKKLHAGQKALRVVGQHPIIATVSAGSLALLVFTVIFSLIFNSIWIGLGTGSFVVIIGVVVFIIIHTRIKKKKERLINKLTRELIRQNMTTIQRQNTYAEIIATIQQNPNHCDRICGSNSINKELGGNFKVDGKCVCVCKDATYNPDNMPEHAWIIKPKNFALYDPTISVSVKEAGGGGNSYREQGWQYSHNMPCK